MNTHFYILCSRDKVSVLNIKGQSALVRTRHNLASESPLRRPQVYSGSV
jgi:hypothetical protein